MPPLIRLSTILLYVALVKIAPLRADESTSSTEKLDNQAETTNRPSAKKSSTPRKPPKKTAAQTKKEAARAKWLEVLKERARAHSID